MSPSAGDNDNNYYCYTSDDVLYYSLLNVDRNASSVDIDRNYKFLSRSFHPDKQRQRSQRQRRGGGGGDDTNNNNNNIAEEIAQSSFIGIKTAHEVLADRILRLAYDVGGRRAVALIKKSQQQHAAAAAKRRETGGGRQSTDDEDDDDDDESGRLLGSNIDLYAAMEAASSLEDAIQILQDALEEAEILRQTSPHQANDLDGAYGDEDHDDEEEDEEVARRKAAARSASLTTLNASMEVPYSYREDWDNGYAAASREVYGRSSSPLERERATIHVHLSRPLFQSTTSSCTLSAGADTRVHNTGQAELGTSLSCEYQPHLGTQLSVDARIPIAAQQQQQRKRGGETNNNQAKLSLPIQHLSIRTSRQLSSRTAVVMAWAGNPMSLKTWNYSLISYRSLDASTIFGGGRERSSDSSSNKTQQQQQQQPKRLLALWRLAISQKQVAFVMASMKNLSWPQWTVRWIPFGTSSGGGPPFPFKIRYQQSPNRGLVSSASFGGTAFLLLQQAPVSLVYSRYKLCWMSSLVNPKWTVQYGVKYDGRSAVIPIPNCPIWTLICHLKTPEWSLRVPIFLDTVTSTTNPLSFMVCLLLGTWLDEWFDGWRKKSNKKNSKQVQSGMEGLWSAIMDWWCGSSKQERENTSAAASSSSRFFLWMSRDNPVWKQAVCRTAAKKRQQELASQNGLVIMRATLLFNDLNAFQRAARLGNQPRAQQEEDITDLLQFWVVNGQLELPLDDLFSSQQVNQTSQSQSTPRGATPPPPHRFFERLVNWCYDRDRNITTSNHDANEAMTLVIRYQNQGFVYELSVLSTTGIHDKKESLSNILKLPSNDHATQLGLVNRVS